MSLYDKIQETLAFIRQKTNTVPKAGIILGSGLGGSTAKLEIELEIPYKEIPHFPVSTVEGHAGTLIFAMLSGKPVVLMSGRFHFYEGYNMEEITFPIRVIKALGADTLIVSNAAGGMNPSFRIGELMIIKDHINLFPEHPLRGHNDDRLGTRFPDMSEPYDLKLIEKAIAIGEAKGIRTQTGVYIGLTGPTFETPAEYKWLHIIGGDAVGMSTVPEVIVARHGGMRVFAVSIITDLGIAGVVSTVTHEEVLAAANEAAPKLAELVAGLVAEL